MHISISQNSDRKPRMYLTPETQAEGLQLAQVNEELTIRGVEFDTDLTSDGKQQTIIRLAK